MIRVTAEDLEAGTTEVHEITNDVIVVTAGSYYVATVQKYANGTQVWTLKTE